MRCFLAVVAATAVSLASVTASAAAAETPLKGTFNGIETGETVFPIRFNHSGGQGHATYLASTHRT